MSGHVPDAAFAGALAGLPGMGPARLRPLLAAGPPEVAWERVLAGDVSGVTPELAGRWRAAAAGTDVAALWGRACDLGLTVLTPGAPGWPEALIGDPEPPAVLFAQGDPSALGRPAVAVVGTRRCTHAGRQVARQLGADLAAAGVCVVSGLALGIDGAAHAGALAAGATPPAAVVGTGLDVVYPRAHEELWQAVAAAGVVLSEAPPGTTPERWRFPARNRLIAGVADVVVVVESRARGGSLHTVESAIERGRTVMAVPGSVRSPASDGTNALLAAGCPPCRDVDDVLVALGLEGASPATRQAAPAPPAGAPSVVLEALGWEPATVEQLAERVDVPLGPLMVHLAALERDGWVSVRAGWVERLR
jgi:DNA processing protein